MTTFVHRQLDMSGVDAIGLDLDHTLAIYVDELVNAIAFAEVCDLLVEHRGYPASIRDLRYAHALAARGLVLDTQHGNVIKLDADTRVLRGLHGSVPIGDSDLLTTYGATPFPLDAGSRTLNSPFDLPTGCGYMLLTQHLESRTDPIDFGTLCDDIRSMLDRSHTRGRLKSDIESHMGRYLWSPDGVPRMVRRFRDARRRVFVLTNSDLRYTTAVLDHLFPGEWDRLFDVVAVNAGKPGYFSAPRGATHHGDGTAKIISGGGVGDLQELLGVAPERTLYAGDNVEHDMAPARSYGWKTALVVPELEEDRAHPLWGAIMSENGGATRFARRAGEVAHVVLGRVDRLLAVSPHHVFEVTPER